MPIRFKFRSSLNFDTLDTGDRGSISVAELREKILHGKVLQQRQQGFDLIFTDEVSGLEYMGDDSQIPSGSNVIVRRVPAEIQPQSVSSVVAAKDIRVKASNNQNTASEPTNQFHFGSDLLPNPDSNFPDLSSDFNNDNFIGNKKNAVAGLRDLDSSGISRLESEKLDSCELTQTIVGFNQSENERCTVQAIDEPMKLNKLSTSTFAAEQSINLPLEFKCLLCNNFFKEAVMIPCCQHSFCEICIRQVLTEKKSCPKCYSSKCNIKDLLPNLSLREAIKHFLESQMIDTGLGNDMQTYVPDGESHIQAKDVSSALALQPQQVNRKDMREDSYHRHSIKKETQDFTPSQDFQGENQPVIPLANHDEAHSHTNINRGYNFVGGDRNFVGGGPRKGFRTCYTCGAPDHLMRDCPVANPNHMFQPGNGMFHGGMPPYAPPYWNGPSLPPFRPYATIYGDPAMMAFNASMATATPYVVPPYMGPMLGGLPGSDLRMGNMGPPHLPDRFGLQLGENKRKHSDEDTGSEQLSENRNDSRNSSKKPHDSELKKDKKASSSHSGDSLAQCSGRKSWNDQHAHSDVDERYDRASGSSAAGTGKRSSNGKWLNSGKKDLPENIERSDAKHTHSHHHGLSKKSHEKRDHYNSNSSMGHEQAPKDVKRRYEHDDRGSYKKHHSSSGSGFDHHSSSHRRGEYKERDSRHDDKHLREKQRDDRRMPFHGSAEDIRDGHRARKRRAY